MLRLVHRVASWVLKRRIEQIEHFMLNPLEVQDQLFHSLIQQAETTIWGQTYGYQDAGFNLERFRQQVPISTYEQLYPWFEREWEGEAEVLWPGRRNWFSKSSGTTNDKSKFIPVSPEALEECHYKAGQDMLALYFEQNPESKLFTGKSVSIGGSHFQHPTQKHIRYGDVSAVLLENLPRFYELMRAPNREIALITDWEEKLEMMSEALLHEEVTALGGVPTWTLLLLRYMLDKYGVESGNMRELWPNLEVFFHGGVNFEPYRKQFDDLIHGEDMYYMNCYNASEGYFALQNDLAVNDMLLLLDYGIFYEFVPVDQLDEAHPQALTLDQVEAGQTYAMVISTNAGLWRYLIGDTVTFTSTYPFKIQVAGRTQHFINAFGEELMVDNAEKAIAYAAEATDAVVQNYTAGPIYLEGQSRGGHEWVIEFSQRPTYLPAFVEALDQQLRMLNTDYDAKRQKDLALLLPTVHEVPEGTFFQWMKKRGKLGGQNKVPRLANHRKYVEDILSMVAHQSNR